MFQHARRDGVVAAEERTDGFGEKFLLVQTEPVFHIGDCREQEFHAFGIFMPLREGFVSVDHALLFGQAAEPAVQIGIGALRLPYGEIAKPQESASRQRGKEVGIAAAGVQHDPFGIG